MRCWIFSFANTSLNSLQKHTMLYEYTYVIFTDFSNRKKKTEQNPLYMIGLKKERKKLHRKWKSGKSSKALYRWDKLTGRFLVHNLWITVIILQVSKDVIGASAAEVAEAGLNPQHLPGESRPVGTLKLHVNGFGFVGDAAAFVGADAAVFGPVRFLAGAAGDGEVCWLIFPVDIKTFLPWLREQRNRKILNIKTISVWSVIVRVCETTTLMCLVMSTSHGRRLQRRDSLNSSHRSLALEILMDRPRPQVFEHGLHEVVWVMQFLCQLVVSAGKTRQQHRQRGVQLNYVQRHFIVKVLQVATTLLHLANQELNIDSFN